MHEDMFYHILRETRDHLRTIIAENEGAFSDREIITLQDAIDLLVEAVRG